MTDAPMSATLWIIVASATLTVMAGAILGPVVPQIQTGVGVSGSLAGLIITAHGVFIVLASPVAGALVDRLGPRRPYVAGLFVYAVGGGAGLIVDEFLPLLVTRAVLGVGVALVYTGITVLIYDLYEGRRMDRALGLRSGANSVGAAVWPLIGGGLGAVSWQLPFAVYLVALPLAVAAAATIPGTGREADTPPGEPADAETSAGGLAAVLDGFRRRPALLAVYLLYFTANVFLYVIVVFYPQLLETVGVSSSLWIGLYLAVNGLAGGVSAVLYDRLKARAGPRRLVLWALLLWVVAFGLAAALRSPVGLAVPAALFGLGVGLVFPSAFGWIEALAPERLQGQFSSYLAMAGYLGQFVSPLLFWVALSPFGVRGVFTVAAIAAAVGLSGVGLVAVASSWEFSTDRPR